MESNELLTMVLASFSRCKTMQGDARRLRHPPVVLGLQLLRARRPRGIHGLHAGEASNQ